MFFFVSPPSFIGVHNLAGFLPQCLFDIQHDNDLWLWPDLQVLWMLMHRLLQEKLDQPVSAPPSPRDINNGDTARNLVQHIDNLRGEVTGLKSQLRAAQIERKCSWDICMFVTIMDKAENDWL